MALLRKLKALAQPEETAIGKMMLLPGRSSVVRTPIGFRYGLLFLLLWLSLFSLPRFPSHRLDPSWGMVLAYAVEQNLQFGKDIIFAYGPLGFLMPRIYGANYFYTYILWTAFYSAVATWLVMRTAAKLSRFDAFVCYLPFLLFGTTANALYSAVVVLLGVFLIAEEPKEEKLTPLLVSAFLAVNALIKFNVLLLTGAVLASAALYNVVRKRSGNALLMTGTYGLVFVGVWIALGQNPLNIPSYLINSLEVSSGYADAMAVKEESAIFYLGIVTLGGVLFYLIVSYLTHPQRLTALFLIVVVGASLYLQWKHGFVRADAFHCVPFFVFILFLVTTLPGWLTDARLRKFKGTLVLFTASAAIAGVMIVRPAVVTRSVASWKNRVVENFLAFAGLRQTHWSYHDRWKAEQIAFDMPSTKKEVGAASLDLLGYEQAVVLYNSFNYTPRPTIQSITAYTPALIKANIHFFQSAAAPKYVLQKYQTIDNRFPSLDEAWLLTILFKDYSYVLAENGFLLWKRKGEPNKQSTIESKFVRQERVRFNQRVFLRELEQDNVWITVRYVPSWLGSIRAFLYKPPLVNITVSDIDGVSRTFRLIGPMAQEGFLLNPLIENQFDLSELVAGRPTKRITALSIDVLVSDRKYFQDVVELRFSSLSLAPAVPVPNPDLLLRHID